MLQITKKKELNKEQINKTWIIYNDSFKIVNSESPCKQSFNKQEFFNIINASSIIKFLLLLDGKIVGLGLITNEFSNLPWISEEYFKKKFNIFYDKKNIYYFLGIAIDNQYKKRGYSKILINEMFKSFTNVNDLIIGFDHSSKVNPFIPYFTKFIKIKTKKTKIESQNYYVISFK